MNFLFVKLPYGADPYWVRKKPECDNEKITYNVHSIYRFHTDYHKGNERRRKKKRKMKKREKEWQSRNGVTNRKRTSYTQ